MIFPENFENKIDFDSIKFLIKTFCISESSKLLIDQMHFSTNINTIKQQLDETEEMTKICLLKDDYPTNSFYDISSVLNRLKIENNSLQINELISIKTVLEQARSLIAFFKKDIKDDFLNLNKKIAKINFPKYIYDRIDGILTKNGTIKDSASLELKNIRRELCDKQNSVSKKINSILGNLKTEGWISKDLSASYLNGRLVVPIESSYKRKIKGLIIDESATGKTTYIEPQEVIELNNEIRELELLENREIQRILFEITKEFRPYYQELIDVYEIVTDFDFIRAKAKFAISIEAIKPAVVQESCLDLQRAKHPLLYLTLKKEKKEIVPISFKLDNENRILLISGPNAGGKSVCLKTTALLTYMVQCGLLVPVGGASVFGIFEKIFIDIGDQQSIENDLSTYSSHLQNMKFFLKNANKNSLILIDEFGAGTDPVIGGLIAENILEELNNNELFGVITTHYSNLKIFAANTSGISNAAMLIDNNKMNPTFILETGIPGSSYAIEIAQKTGLPQNIIEKTKQKADNNLLSFDKLLRKTLKDKRYWENKKLEIKNKEKKLEDLIQKNYDEIEKLKNSKAKIISEAKKQVEELLLNVNKKIENTIKTIIESNAEKEITKQARENFQEFKKEITTKLYEENDELQQKSDFLKKNLSKYKQQKEIKFVEKINENKINIGSMVAIIGQDVIGRVIDMNEKSAVVAFGNIFTSIEFSQLEKVKEKNQEKLPKKNFVYNDKIVNFSPNIDVRGNTVDEAIQKVSNLVDNAIMLNFKELKILHGKGNGILRFYIREFLRTISQIERCYSEDVQFGGDGITIVKIK